MYEIYRWLVRKEVCINWKKVLLVFNVLKGWTIFLSGHSLWKQYPEALSAIKLSFLSQKGENVRPTLVNAYFKKEAVKDFSDCSPFRFAEACSPSLLSARTQLGWATCLAYGDCINLKYLFVNSGQLGFIQFWKLCVRNGFDEQLDVFCPPGVRLNRSLCHCHSAQHVRNSSVELVKNCWATSVLNEEALR